MNKIILALFILIPLFYVTGEEGVDKKFVSDAAVYDPFFVATITDNEGNIFNISKVSFLDDFKDKKFFFWMRRNSALYSLEFKNIKKITFDSSEFSDVKYKNFSKCNVELITGEILPMYMKTTGSIEGRDRDLGSNVSLYLHYNLIKSIEFIHDGDYYICPFCGTIYWGDSVDRCIYDKTPLEKGVLEKSDK